MAHNVLDTLQFRGDQTASLSQTYASPAGDGSRVSPIAVGLLNSSNSPFYDNDGTSTYKFRPDLAGKIYSVLDGRNGTQQPKLLRCVQLNCFGGTSSGQTAVPGGVVLAVQTMLTTGKTPGGRGTALQMGNTTINATHGRFGVVAMAGGVLTAASLNAGLTPALGTTAAPTTPTTTTAGLPAKPLSDSYGEGRNLLCGDWVYVVEEGPCLVPLSGDGGAAYTLNKEVQCGNDGGWKDATDGTTVCGTWSLINNTNAAVTTGGFTLQPYQGLMMVKRGYQADETGG